MFLGFGSKGRKATRPAERRRLRPDVEGLGARLLLSGLSGLGVEPTAEEQYMLQLINRARANPVAEGQRLVAEANTDPTLQAMIRSRNWDLNAFVAEINSHAPTAPLAFNTRLIASARRHDQVMLAANDQKHSAPDFLTNPARAAAADGQAYFPLGQSAWSTGENIYAFSRNVSGSPRDYVDYYHAGLMIDWGNPDFGHLENILARSPSQFTWTGHWPYSEIGIGLLAGAEPTAPPAANPQYPDNRGLRVGPVIVTQHFGWRGDKPAALVGAVSRDNDGDRFYTPGEGLGGVIVRAVGLAGQGTFEVPTWGSGGYTLSLPPGTYSVAAIQAGTVLGTTTATVGVDNAAWDVTLAAAPPVAATPPPATSGGIAPPVAPPSTTPPARVKTAVIRVKQRSVPASSRVQQSPTPLLTGQEARRRARLLLRSYAGRLARR